MLSLLVSGAAVSGRHTIRANAQAAAGGRVASPAAVLSHVRGSGVLNAGTGRKGAIAGRGGCGERETGGHDAAPGRAVPLRPAHIAMGCRVPEVPTGWLRRPGSESDNALPWGRCIIVRQASVVKPF